MNCWQIKKCGEAIRNRCPAFQEDRGRDCWKLTGTLCDSGRQQMASLEEKIAFCRKCDFYREHANKF